MAWCATAYAACAARSNGPAGRRNGTRQARGYGADWQRLRAAVIAQRRAQHGGAVICEGSCGLPIAGQIHADHRVPFAGLADPLRLDPTNLELLCVACHMAKTVRQRI